METQGTFDELEIGNIEQQELKPMKVKIVGQRTENVGLKNTPKIVCVIKHPSRDLPVEISSVRIENKGQLKNLGLWVSIDTDGKLSKKSALAKFLNYLGAKKISELVGKECDTTLDDGGYLIFKAY